MRRALKTGSITILCLLVATVAGLAQFGGVVTDPGAYARMATELDQLRQEYSQIQNIYSQAKLAAQNVTNKDSWMPTQSTWQQQQYANTYGNTSGWSEAVNTGSGAPAGYSAVTVPLQPYGSVLSTYDPGSQAALRSQYGLAEIRNGAVATALAQTGSVYAASSQNQAAIAQLAAASRSNAQGMNTQAAILNQVSAAGVVQANQQVQQTQLLAADVNLRAAQVAAANAEAIANINDRVAFRSTYQRLADSRTMGTSAAINGFKP